MINIDDTITAISTPPGQGGIGVIRISGPDSWKIGRQVFVPGNGKEPQDRYMTYGHIVDRDSAAADGEEGSQQKPKVIDEVMCVFLKGPRTYTTEDMVEIDCHGGTVPLRRTLELILRAGARPADRGEFTKRAFLGGRIDLSQAEAVMDLISAKADRTFDVAMEQLEGSESAAVGQIRDHFVDILVNLTVNIDYPDEDIEVMTYEKLEQELMDVREEIDELRDSAETGRILRDGLRVAIVGKPNVGKSSLMNAMLRESRAIVTDIPGTTRDTIEESMSIRGIPVVLTDTAGIRETTDQIEAMGIQRSRASFNQADLVIIMIDGSRELSEEDIEILGAASAPRTLILINKGDLAHVTEVSDVRQHLPETEKDGVEILCTSLAEGSGDRSAVEEAIIRRVMGPSEDGSTGSFTSDESISDGAKTGSTLGISGAPDRVLVTDARHKALLDRASQSVSDALKLVQIREPLEIIEIDVNSAYENLGEITGESATEDILDEVFKRFCLGK